MLERLLVLFQLIRTNLSAKRCFPGHAKSRLRNRENPVRTALVMCLMAGLGVGILSSCGGSSKPAAAANGTLFTFIGDTPLCDALSSRFTISGLSLTTPQGVGPFSVIPSSSSYRMNLGGLRDFETILSLGSIQAGIYDQATLDITLLELGIYNPSLSPPTTVVTATLSNNKPTFNIDPPLVMTAGTVSALEIDFDMLRSITLNTSADGSLSAVVTPVFNVTTLTADPVTGFGEMDDLMGFVRSVTTYSPTPNFVGSFLMQFLSGSLPSGAAVTVSYTSNTASYVGNTVIYGLPELNQLLTDSFVEVDGYVDVDGNLVANTVQVEFQEDLTQNETALIGLVTALQKDPNNNLTGFNLWVRQEEPDDSSSVPLDGIVEVNVSPATTYQFSSPSTNFANLTFDPATLTVGQEVIVHGPFTAPGKPQPITVAADKVYLKLQSMQGSFASRLQVGSDDKTGAFQLTPCCTLLQGAPIYVLTNNQTAFVNVPGLGELNTQASLLVKGLPFFQPLGGTINGVAVPPGTLVLLAKQVHQLQ